MQHDQEEPSGQLSVLTRALRMLGQILLVLLVVAALFFQLVAAWTPLGRVLAECYNLGWVPVEAYWYGASVLVIAAAVSITSWMRRAVGSSGVLAGTLLAVGVLTALLFVLVAFVSLAFWERWHDFSAAEWWSQFVVYIAAYATPALALILAARLMFVRRKGKPLPLAVPPAAFLAFTLASVAFQVIRNWVVC
ncbi:hypothetical protein [Rathayibacter sp. AY1F9]|uniref:hypothetical protein n=1 Tax=Rathayibacter sp. AY1F9 TaxID=2080563 RepID=UPI000CE84FFC|nr:hypothetical protein [Rathayibacter sp. AY1F9]PPH31265.1 hypothetical protein C5C37_01850 [Rathayibacter sp. AY1F9]